MFVSVTIVKVELSPLPHDVPLEAIKYTLQENVKVRVLKIVDSFRSPEEGMRCLLYLSTIGEGIRPPSILFCVYIPRFA